MTDVVSDSHFIKRSSVFVNVYSAGNGLGICSRTNVFRIRIVDFGEAEVYKKRGGAQDNYEEISVTIY